MAMFNSYVSHYQRAMLFFRHQFPTSWCRAPAPKNHRGTVLVGLSCFGSRPTLCERNLPPGSPGIPRITGITAASWYGSTATKPTRLWTGNTLGTQGPSGKSVPCWYGWWLESRGLEHTMLGWGPMRTLRSGWWLSIYKQWSSVKHLRVSCMYNIPWNPNVAKMWAFLKHPSRVQASKGISVCSDSTCGKIPYDHQRIWP